MTDDKLAIGIVGASGRMGRSVAALIESDYSNRATIAAKLSQESGRLDDLSAVAAIIDFSLPEGTSVLVDWLSAQPTPLPVYLCGTTGLSRAQYAQLESLSKSTPVFHATNFSTGVAALAAILKFAAPMLTTLSYTPQMSETHHVHKLDAPSGTARTLQEVIDPTGSENIEIQSIREGEVVGRHEVVFAGVADNIFIGHDASDRSLFARGAIDAALWLSELGDDSGMHTMESSFAARFLS